MFVYGVEKKGEIIPSEWTPSVAKLIMSKVSWLPRKIKKYVRLIQVLVNTYRIDLGTFKNTADMLANKGLFTQQEFKADHKFRADKPEKIVIYNNDDIKHNAMHIPKKYPNSLKFYLEHGNNEFIKLNIAEFLSPYLERHYLRDNVISNIILMLDQRGFLSMIDRPYNDYLLYLNESLQREPKNAKEWNNKAILSICILGKPFDKPETSRDVGYDQAIDSYNKAIEFDPDYFEAWNNKGVAYMDRDKYGDKRYDYERAKECFETAIKCFDKALEYDKKNTLSEKDYADIYNNLGVCYYELQDYDEAMKCFAKALEIDNSFSLSEDNSAIALEKINGKTYTSKTL